MSERLDLRGRTVLITGAARGIGAGLAHEVARRGARLSLVGIEPELMEAVADEIRATHGVDVIVSEADVRDRVALAAAVERTVAELGGIDVVVANAGVETAGSLQNMPAAEFDRVIDVNLIGVFNTLQATIGHVIERKGHLLPIASAAAISHAPSTGAYCASKAAVEALANVLRQELAGTGATVGCGYFTFLDTDMVADAFHRPLTTALRAEMPKALATVYPLEPAIQRLADGIEKRGRVVAYPDWVRGMARLRGYLQPLTERLVGSKAANAIRQAEADERASS